MKENKRTTNILLRVNDSEKTLISIKSKLFNRKTSDYLRHSAFSHWEDIGDTKHFKVLLKMYQEGDKNIKEQVVELLFQYYRRNGFPYVSLTEEQRENRMNRIIKSKDVLLEDNNLQMNFNGLDLVNSFHPHMMDAYYKKGKDISPYQAYSDDGKFKDCINRWLELGKTPNYAGIRKILKTRDGVRGVVNFKPTISKFIYDNYCPEGGMVLDPCSGYSGRLAGCIASNRNIFYHGIDPNGKTAIGNMEMASLFSSQYDVLSKRIYNYRFRFDLGCAEEVMPELKDNKYDLVFTSPPYFNTEIYSNNSNQSAIKYEEYERWKNEFLFRIVDESYRILKEDGYLVLNVKNIAEKKIADDLRVYCESRWDLYKTYYMRLANSSYNRKHGDTFHTEPIFVFKKS